MSQTTLNPALLSGGRTTTGSKGGGLFHSFFAALRTARAIEAGVSPKAGDLAQLGIEPDAFARIR